MDSLSQSIERLTALLNTGIITADEFERKREALVDFFVGLPDEASVPTVKTAAVKPSIRPAPSMAHRPATTIRPYSGVSAAYPAYRGAVGRSLAPMARAVGGGRAIYGARAPFALRTHPYAAAPPFRAGSTAIKVQPVPAGATEEDLAQAFAEFGEVTSAAIHRGTPPYGHVNFSTPDAAAAATAAPRFEWLGQECVVTLSRRRWQPVSDAAPNSGIGLFNLPMTMTYEELHGIVSQYPGLLVLKMVHNKPSLHFGGEFRGYAFAYFDSVENATQAKDALTGMQIGDLVIDVKYSIKPMDPAFAASAGIH